MLEKLIQVLPQEMVQILTAASQEANRSLSEEIALRLYATLKAPEAFTLNDLFTAIFNHKFSEADFQHEREYLKRCEIYQYELSLLELMLRYEKVAPKNFPTNFLLVSPAVEGAMIRKSLNQDRLKNNNGE